MAELADTVSPATKALLAIFGISIAGVVMYMILLVIRVVRSFAQDKSPKTAARTRTPAADVAASTTQTATAGAKKPSGSKQADLKSLIKQSKQAQRVAATKEDMAVHHALFVNTLKGHTDTINSIAWSPNGRLIATACDDMEVRLFDLQDLSSQNIKYKKIETKQVPLGVGFGNDGNSIIAALRGYPGLQLVHLVPHKKGNSITWEPEWNKQGILGHEMLLDMSVVPSPQSEGLGHSHAGGIAVLLSEKKEGRVYGLSAGGDMGEFRPNSLANHALTVSANGRFIAVASFTAEVMIWEVQWGRDGFKGLSRVMDLKGHSSQVMSAALSPDGSRAATASKDGTLRVWNTAVRYHLQEDPKQLLKVDLPLLKDQVFERMAWGPDGTIAAALGGHIHFIDSKTGKVLEVLHAHDGRLTCMAWCPRLLQLSPTAEPTAVLASSSSDRRVRIWKSPAGVQQ